jgi:hypothetical protein
MRMSTASFAVHHNFHRFFDDHVLVQRFSVTAAYPADLPVERWDFVEIFFKH